MKNKKNISLNKMPVIFLASAVVCVLLRTVQMFSLIDHETGFYTESSIITGALYAVLLITSLYFVIVSFLSADIKKIDVYAKKTSALCVSSVIFAVSFFCDAVTAFSSCGDSMDLSAGTDLFRSMMTSGTIPLFFRSIFAVFSGIYFVIFAKGIIKSDLRASKHKILALAPVGWAAFRIIHRFVEQISYIKVSDLFLELIMFSVMILFFMAFAQIASGVYVEGFRWRICGFGFTSALLALTLNLARLIFVLVKGGNAINVKYPYCLCDFVFALFVAVLLITVIKNGKLQKAEQE